MTGVLTSSLKLEMSREIGQFLWGIRILLTKTFDRQCHVLLDSLGVSFLGASNLTWRSSSSYVIDMDVPGDNVALGTSTNPHLNVETSQKSDATINFLVQLIFHFLKILPTAQQHRKTMAWHHGLIFVPVCMELTMNFLTTIQLQSEGQGLAIQFSVDAIFQWDKM